MIWLFMAIFMVHGQMEIPDPNGPVPAPVDDSITLLGSHAYSCGHGDSGKHCARNLVYDKGTNELHVFITDNRKKEYGDVDINHVLRDPASYTGALNSISLEREFDIEGKKITNLNASFTKELNIKVVIIVDGKNLKKTIVPRN